MTGRCTGGQHHAPIEGGHCPCGTVSRHPVAAPVRAGDEAIVAELAEVLFACVQPEIDGTEQDWDEARSIAAALLPTVRRVAEERAAEELRAAADVLGFTPLSERESGVVSHYTAALHAGARIVSLRAAALTATPDHGRSAT